MIKIFNQFINSLFLLSYTIMHFLLFFRAFSTLLLGTWCPPLNRSSESWDASEKSITPKLSLSMHDTINVYCLYTPFSWQYHGQQHHRKYWENQPNRLLMLPPTNNCGVNGICTLTWWSLNKQLLWQFFHD